MLLPDFKDLVKKRVHEITERQMLSGIALQHVRLRENQADYDAVCKVQDARRKRAARLVEKDGPDAIEPGDLTGLLTRRVKAKGVVESAFDRELVEVKIKLREESAIEVGDRDKDKHGSEPVTVNVVYVDQTIRQGKQDLPLTITASADSSETELVIDGSNEQPATEEGNT